ncbi:MAG: 30S ribosomal protein S16 [Patescibacteria group bacterium]
MLSIRFSRKGKKKSPLYSLIVLEKSKDPWGDYIEKLGTYNPRTKEVELKSDRITHWIGIGAQATPTVHNLLVAQGIIKAEKVRAGKSQPGKKRSAEIAGAKKAEDEAKAKAEADKLTAEEAAKAPKVEEVSVEPAVVETVAEVAETPAVEEVPAEAVAEPVVETASEVTTEETKTE